MNFNLSLDDGERHKNVQPGEKALRGHDCFSLAAVLRFVEPDGSNESVFNIWINFLEFLNLGDLENVLNILSSVEPETKLKLVN
jgi:hypothetical protein